MTMKMLLAIYSEEIDDDVMTRLTEAGLVCYTKWTDVLGRGKSSGPRLDNKFWPGVNNVAMFVLPDETVPRALEILKDIRKENLGHEGMKAFVLNVEQKIE
jgi:nitrogen regulatory protein PII